MKPLILGEVPPRPRGSAEEAAAIARLYPLSGEVGVRLCKLAGLEPDAEGSRYARYYWPLKRAYDVSNLLQTWPGPRNAPGALFPHTLACQAVSTRASEWEGRVIVLLGSRLRGLFGGGARSHFTWWESGGARLVSIPHIEVSRLLYNDIHIRARARTVLQEAKEVADVQRGYLP